MVSYLGNSGIDMAYTGKRVAVVSISGGCTLYESLEEFYKKSVGVWNATVFLGPGVHQLNSNINLLNNSRIVGSGVEQTFVRVSPGKDRPESGCFGIMGLPRGQVKDVTISDLTVTSDMEPITRPVIRTRNCFRIKMQNLRFVDISFGSRVKSIVSHEADTWDVNWSNFQFYKCNGFNGRDSGLSNISFDSEIGRTDKSEQINSLEIHEGHMENCAVSLIEFKGSCRNATVTRSKFHGPSKSYEGYLNLRVGGLGESFRSPMILCKGCADIKIFGCRFNHSLFAAIENSMTDNVLIADSTFEGNDWDIIEDTTTRTMISRNDFSFSGRGQNSKNGLGTKGVISGRVITPDNRSSYKLEFKAYKP